MRTLRFRRESIWTMVVLILLSLSLGTRRVHASIIYWTELGSIYRAEGDGSGKETLFVASAAQGSASGLAIDPVTNKLYWYGRSNPGAVNSGYGLVARMNLDGSGLEYVLTTGLGTITYGFDIDPVARTMYMGEHQQMKRANLDGTGLINLPITTLYSGEIEVDATGGRIYYTENSSFVGILSADLNGNGVANVFSGEASAFSIDYLHSKIYMSEGFPYVGNMGIKRANLNGTGLETLVPGLSLVNSVETDIAGGKVYWMTNTKIQRSNLDGSQVEDLIILGGSASLAKEDMILDLRSNVVPEPSTFVSMFVLGITGLVCRHRRRRKLAA